MNGIYQSLDDFLGLSPDQMHRILYSPFENTIDIIDFNSSVEKNYLGTAPVVKNICYFINRLHELEPLKATAKGFLPQKFVKELHSKLFSKDYIGSVRSEMDSLHLHSLRIVLKAAGWIKYQNKAYSLTQKGRRIAEKGFTGLHFFELFKIYTQKFNWAYMDGYPDINIIQTSFLFSLYMLSILAKENVPAELLGKRFIKAFPAALNGIDPTVTRQPEETLIYAFSLRFIERFCEYFGFVEIRREKGESYRDQLFGNTTDLFDRFFKWSN